MNIKAVIFDLDGTLLDTLVDIANSANHVLLNNGYPTHPTHKYKDFIGEGSDKIITGALPKKANLENDVIKKIIDEYYDYYSRNCTVGSSLYTGVEEFLTTLYERDITLAILSNKSDSFVHQCVNFYFKKDFFKIVLGSNLSWERKPAPDGLLLVSETIGVDVSNCVYIGDSGTDVKAALSAQMRFIGVSWGYDTVENLLASGAKNIASDIAHLTKVILQQ